MFLDHGHVRHEKHRCDVAFDITDHLPSIGVKSLMNKSRSKARGWPEMALAMLAFAFCVAASLPALAQTGLNGIVKSVSALDKNFDMADSNHDGLLSKIEAQAGNVPFIVNHFDAIDTQHRGLVSKQDVHAFILRSLQKQSQPAVASSAAKPD